MDDQYQSRVICVFVSAALSSMQADRDYLHKFTFRRLSEYCASRGVVLKIVDLRWEIAGEDTAPEDVLQLTLEELQRSRPYYIGLIGESYGTLIERIPEQLQSRWPLLAQYHGRSTNDLEIVLGVLRDEAMYGRGFFYFRDPKSVDVKDQEVSEESVESSDSARKLNELKQSICDVSREGFCRLRENYRNVEELGEWVFDDFKQLIDKLWPAAERQTAVKPYDDDVMFTVYRLGTVAPEKWYSLLAFAHLSQRRPDAPADEPDPLAEVQRQAQQILGDKMAQYRASSQDSSSVVPHAGEITFTPFITGVDFNPSSRSFRWEESVHREEFKMRATTAPDGEVATGWLRVYLGPLILAQINLSIKVDSKSVSQAERQVPQMESARPSRKVFASYSHKDQAIVERIEELLSQTSLGIEYLRDVKKLRSGEVWSPRLMEMIREANAFQLFWSTNSMRSDFVRQEYQYALGLRREDFVRPVFWETPFPEKSEDGLPPEELKCLHFERLAQTIAGRERAGRERSSARKRARSRSSDATSRRSADPTSPANPRPRSARAAPQSTTLRSESVRSYSKRSNTKPLLVALISATTIIAVGMIGLYSRSTLYDRSAATVSTNSNSNTNLPFETGRVEGSVRDLAGRPVADTTVTILNGAEARTNEDGYFVLKDVPAGVQLIELSSRSSKTATQSVRIEPHQTTPLSMIYDSATSKIGLLSITEPVNSAVLKVDRAESQFQGVVSGQCDGLKEILGRFEVWVLIRPEDGARSRLHLAAVIDLNSNTWQATIPFGDAEHPWSNGRFWQIVAIAARSESDIKRILTMPTVNPLPVHIVSEVVTVVASER
jgi:hypothetical protein